MDWPATSSSHNHACTRRARPPVTGSTVPSDETYDDRSGGILTSLVAPLRLPERLVATLEIAAEALEHVGPMRSEVVTIRKRSESLDEFLPALDGLKKDLGGRLDSLHEIIEKLEGVESHLDRTVDELVDEIKAVHKTVRDLHDDVERMTDRLPDPDAPGPLERARDAITGGD